MIFYEDILFKSEQRGFQLHYRASDHEQTRIKRHIYTGNMALDSPPLFSSRPNIVWIGICLDHRWMRHNPGSDRVSARHSHVVVVTRWHNTYYTPPPPPAVKGLYERHITFCLLGHENLPQFRVIATNNVMHMGHAMI